MCGVKKTVPRLDSNQDAERFFSGEGEIRTHATVDPS